MYINVKKNLGTKQTEKVISIGRIARKKNLKSQGIFFKEHKAKARQEAGTKKKKEQETRREKQDESKRTLH
jgi:hypothetical protein